MRLSEVSGGAFAHDAVNRFLNREAYSARDLFEEAGPLIALEGGILSVDDTILDKPYSWCRAALKSWTKAVYCT